MYTAVELNNYIQREGVAAEILFLEMDTPTVAMAAAALAISAEQIVKSVLFLADGRPLLVVASGSARLSYKRLADYLGISRRRLKMASPEEVVTYTGYVVGSVPPLGHKQAIRTIVETAVTQLSQPTIYGGGGNINALMRLTVAELQRVVGAETAVLLGDEAPN